MPVTLNFSIEGQERVRRTLGIHVAGFKTYREPLGNIGKSLMKTFDVNFSGRGSLYGGWKPRKPQYRNGRRVDTWPLLERTGKLRKGFRSHPSSHQLVVDNDVPYFIYHQSRASRRKLPRRAMMALRRQEAEMVVKSFQAYLVALARKAGTR